MRGITFTVTVEVPDDEDVDNDKQNALLSEMEEIVAREGLSLYDATVEDMEL